jgi:hypothetical protein
MWWVRQSRYALGYREGRPDRTVRRPDGTDSPAEFLAPAGGNAAVPGRGVRTDSLADGRWPTVALVVDTVGFNTAEPGGS